MVGNAAAALHGAPVTTLDIDFMFRKTPVNLKKLKAVVQGLRAVILKPYYPVSDLFRVVNDDQGMQLDFMTRLHGVRSFEGLRSRATVVEFGEHQLKIACLADIIKSKRATGRDRHRQLHPMDWSLQRPVASASQAPWDKQFTSKNRQPRKAQEAALKKESDRALTEQIRRLLALPMNKRTDFLRVWHPSGGSHL